MSKISHVFILLAVLLLVMYAMVLIGSPMVSEEPTKDIVRPEPRDRIIEVRTTCRDAVIIMFYVKTDFDGKYDKIIQSELNTISHMFDSEHFYKVYITKTEPNNIRVSVGEIIGFNMEPRVLKHLMDGEVVSK